MTDETKQQLSSILGSLLSYIVDHIKEFTLVYAVVAGALWVIWVYALEGHTRAFAGSMIYDELVRPCEKDDQGNRKKTLACDREEDAEREDAQTKAIQELTRKLTETQTTQTIIQSDQATIKNNQQEILFFLQKAYPSITPE